MIMNVLSIGTDRKLFQVESAVSARTLLYGKKIGRLSMVVFSLKSHNLKTTTLSPEVIVYPTNSSNRLMYIFDAIRIGKEIVLKEKFVRGDSVVTCQDPFECGFVGWRIAQYFKLPLHLQLHTDFLSPYFKTSVLQRVRVVIGKFLLPRASGVRVVSDRIKESLKEHFVVLKQPAQVLPIRISAPEEVVAGEQISFSQFSFSIFMASRLEPEKRIGDALVAFSAVLKQFPKAGLLIAGSGSQEMLLRHKAQSLGIYDSVVFLGWVENISPYIRSSQVFLSTSEYEGYGMSIVEAGLMGVPVVSTSVGIAGELLVDGKNSYVCPVGDTMCITRSLTDLLAHNEKRHVLSMALREDVLKHIPSLDSYVDAYVSGLHNSLTH